MKRLLAAVVVVALYSASAFAQKQITQADKDRASEIVGKMTLEEKINFISGEDWMYSKAIERLGIPRILFSDGPQGVSKGNTSAFPSMLTVTSSWDREAMKAVADGIGKEARASGVGVVLGPGMNIYRAAYCGRNFEYMGEDPYLAGEMAAAYVLGLQQNNVVATAKHFALNNQDFDRYGVSSNCGERALFEIYLPAFKAAVTKGGTGSVMTSYNPLNGTHTAENAWLTRDVLRGKWGFEGFVMSDWVSTYSTVGCLISGLDLEMPGAHALNPAKVKEMVLNGVVSEEIINEKVRNILQVYSAFGLLDKTEKPELDVEASAKIIHDAALGSVVLLKNDGVLPLTKKDKVALLGPAADSIRAGGGSGYVKESTISKTLYAGMSALRKDLVCDLSNVNSKTTAVVAIGFSTKEEGEGFDHPYALPDFQYKLVDEACAKAKNVVVVIFSGCEVDINPFKDKVGAIVMAGFPGANGSVAVAEILCGKSSPSGKLAYTFWGEEFKNPAAKNYKVDPSIFMSGREKYSFVEYSEGIFLGYRGVKHFGVEPIYPFGFGLSYSSFEYSNMEVSPSDNGYDVTFTLKNSGKMHSAEVSQLYVSPINPKVLRPERELKNFEKVSLAPGEYATVKMHIDNDAFARYDDIKHDWVVDKGGYMIQIAASSQDIKLELPVTIK